MNENTHTILVVDDESDIVIFLSYNLQNLGYNVITASCGEECLEVLKTRTPDLILLDVMMPGISGVETCNKIKAQPKLEDIPIIMVTAKSMDKDIIKGLNSGADDYVVKPFSMEILSARIKAQLRRSTKDENQGDIIKVGEIVLNKEKREVLIRDKEVVLTYSRFELLILFLENMNTVFSRKDIVKAIRGEDYPVTERSVDVHIVEMRKLLLEYGECIKTVRGVGYKFSYDK